MCSVFVLLAETAYLQPNVAQFPITGVPPTAAGANCRPQCGRPLQVFVDPSRYAPTDQRFASVTLRLVASPAAKCLLADLASRLPISCLRTVSPSCSRLPFHLCALSVAARPVVTSRTLAYCQW